MRVRFVNNTRGEGYSATMALMLFAVLITSIVLFVNDGQVNMVILAGTNGLTACFAAYIAHACARPVTGIDPVQFESMLDMQDRIRGAQVVENGQLQSIREHLISLSRQPRMLPSNDELQAEAVEVLDQVRLMIEDWQEHADVSGCITLTSSQMVEALSLLAMADSMLAVPSVQLDEQAG